MATRPYAGEIVELFCHAMKEEKEGKKRVQANFLDFFSPTLLFGGNGILPRSALTD